MNPRMGDIGEESPRHIEFEPMPTTVPITEPSPDFVPAEEPLVPA